MVMTEYADKGYVARIVLDAMGERKYEGWSGGFTTALVDAFCKADMENFRRLEAAFPEIGDAMRLYLQVRGGVDALRARAEAF
jgi:hypothetical protein